MIDRFRDKIIRAGITLARHKLRKPYKLPWRYHRTPYRIFLAEMLLVRTRADVVARIYDDVFNQYSNIFALANADEDMLATILYPLGLSKRVPYIIKAAQYICEYHSGKIPKDINILLKVPGLGIYTAAAIAVFAYRQDFVPADVNILRFVSRLTGLEMEHKTKGSKKLRDLTSFLSKEYTGLSAEDLLDFTRLICRSGTPKFDQCPLTRQCVYFRAFKQ
jgi:A/G-specific adenine glycosylase